MKLRTKTGVSIIAITHEGYANVNPGPETIVREGDVLVLLGSPEKADQAIQEIS